MYRKNCIVFDPCIPKDRRRGFVLVDAVCMCKRILKKVVGFADYSLLRQKKEEEERPEMCCGNKKVYIPSSSRTTRIEKKTSSANAYKAGCQKGHNYIFCSSVPVHVFFPVSVR